MLVARIALAIGGLLTVASARVARLHIGRAPDAAGRGLQRLATSGALWALVLYGVGAFLVTANAWHSPATAWSGGCCDPQQSMWYLAWTPYALGHGIDPFFTYQLNAPDGVNLMWQAPMIAAGILIAPVTVLFGPVVAYNVADAAAFTFAGWFTFFALRRYTNGLAGPLVGGAIYGFSSFMAPQAANHLQIALGAAVVPLFLMLVDSIVVRQRRSPLVLGAVLGLVASIELLMFEEFLFTSALIAVIFLIVLAVQRRDQIKRRAGFVATAVLTTTITGVVLCAFPLWIQFTGPQGIHGAVNDSDTFSIDLLNVIVPTSYTRAAPMAATDVSQHFSGIFHEATAYVGVPLVIVLIAFIAVRWRDITVRTAAIVGTIALVFAMGPHLHIAGENTGWPLPWWPVAHTPVLQDATPARITIFIWLAVAALVAILVDRSFTAGVWRATARFAVIAVGVAALIPAPFNAEPTGTPAFFKQWARQGIPESTVVMIAPFFRDGAGAAPMMWTAEAGAGVRMPEAYAFVPSAAGTPMYGPPPNNLSHAMEFIQDSGNVAVVRGIARDAVATDIRALGIDAVIVGPMDHREQMIKFFTDLFGRPAQNVDGVAIWRDIKKEGVSSTPS
ncbi:MAG: hypothetical protein ACREN2_03885 [Candidatus Dormibacteria bacterium]